MRNFVEKTSSGATLRRRHCALVSRSCLHAMLDKDRVDSAKKNASKSNQWEGRLMAVRDMMRDNNAMLEDRFDDLGERIMKIETNMDKLIQHMMAQASGKGRRRSGLFKNNMR